MQALLAGDFEPAGDLQGILSLPFMV